MDGPKSHVEDSRFERWSAISQNPLQLVASDYRLRRAFYFFTPHPIMPGRPLDSKKEWRSAQAPSLRLAAAAAFLRPGGNGRRHAGLKFRPLARESSLKLVAPIFLFRPVRPSLHKAVFHLSEQLRTQIFKMREITAFRTDL